MAAHYYDLIKTKKICLSTINRFLLRECQKIKYFMMYNTFEIIILKHVAYLFLCFDWLMRLRQQVDF